jgi:plasmid stabilization system protein ParE
MKVVLRRLARIEFDDAGDFYEHRQGGLGARFTREVNTIFMEIANHPERFPEVQDGVREAPVMHFPYAIYYQIVPSGISVISIFHTSRDPAVWQRRVV